MGPTRDEWLSALNEVMPHVDVNQDALTVAEFGAKFGMARLTAWRRLTALIEAGRVREVRKRVAVRGGYTRLIPAYLLVETTRRGRTKKA